jgi:uridine phosphorylase
MNKHPDAAETAEVAGKWADYIPLSVKLRTWATQFVLIAIATACGTGIAAVSSAIAIVPLAAIGGISAIVLIGTTINKMTQIENHGWPEFDRTCVRCRRLEADLTKERLDHDEARKALVELKIP